MINEKELKQAAKLCRKLGIKRLAMGELDIEFFEPGPTRKRRTNYAAEQSLDTGEPVPSDDELLFAATPFFQRDAERKAAHQADDQAEDRK